MFGQLVDRIAAVEQDALVAVDIGDRGFAACRGGEAGVVGEGAGLAVERADVDDLRAHRSREHVIIVALPAEGEAGLFVRHARSEEHTSELQSLMRITYAVFCLKK